MFRAPDPPFEPEERSFYSVADPAVAEMLGMSLPNLAGVAVNEQSALGLSAVWRAVSLISGTIASLPLRTIQNTDAVSQRVPSFLDDVGGPGGPTPFAWKETVLAHLLLHGNAYLANVYGGAGQLIGLSPIHPMAVSVECDPTRYKVSLNDGTTRTFTPQTMTHIAALSLDGIRGMSPIQVARNSLGTSIGGERSAARLFANGALISGVLTPDDASLPEEEAKAIREGFRRRVQGESNAGDIAFINKALRFTPWSMNAADAQFLESRAFQVEEVSRWFGVPPHLLAQTDKQTSWGAGVSEQNRGLARYTLSPWTTRIEEVLSRLIPQGRKAEFDYSSFVKPSPEVEIELLIKQVDAGLLTADEARAIRNMPPLPVAPAPAEVLQ